LLRPTRSIEESSHGSVKEEDSEEVDEEVVREEVAREKDVREPVGSQEGIGEDSTGRD
jgi:hypothetical protein